MPESSSRTHALLAFARQALASMGASPANLDQMRLLPLGAEAGFRCYFRVNIDTTWGAMLAVDANPQTEDNLQFVQVANYLKASGLTVPQVFAVDYSQGFLLVEDFGDLLLQRALEQQPEQAMVFYQQAINSLIKLQLSPANDQLIPGYDRALLTRELSLFGEWFCGALLNCPLSSEDQTRLAPVFELLISSALTQPQLLVHRDYHSRNLLLTKNGEIGVIDFQGALWGGYSYDLVSLLRDCYLTLSEHEIASLVDYYLVTANDAGVIRHVSRSEFIRQFDWLGLQRHIKVLGIFARAHLSYNKSHFLGDLPRVLHYVRTIASRYAELAPLADFIDQRLMESISKADWFVGENSNQSERVSGEALP